MHIDKWFGRAAVAATTILVLLLAGQFSSEPPIWERAAGFLESTFPPSDTTPPIPDPFPDGDQDPLPDDELDPAPGDELDPVPDDDERLPGETGRTYYVSKAGSNANGRSWATAWNELSRINWAVIRPGDTILIDGGATAMTYTSTLYPTASGTADNPITIRLASDSGHDGQVIIFGGRGTPLPYCGQEVYVRETGVIRDYGLNLGRASYVVVDGTKWRGIAIFGHDKAGIKLGGDSSSVTVRHVQVYDNGRAFGRENKWYPSLSGVVLAGTSIIFDRVIIHDNGEDAFQSGDGVTDFTLRDSWLYNARKDPGGGIWNYCGHPDGIQVYGGGDSYGITVDSSVIGPGWMQGILLSAKPSGNSPGAVVHDVTVRNSLFYGNQNANAISERDTRFKPTNWRFENVTFDRPVGLKWQQVLFSGDRNQLTIRDSIFTGGQSMDVPRGGDYRNNCQFKVSGTVVGESVDPRYANSAAYGSSATDADFALADDSPCAGRGAKITSASMLLR